MAKKGIAILILAGAVLAAAFLYMPRTMGQSRVQRLVTQPVNNAVRVELRGNVPPLARPEFDQGLVRDSLPMDRMLLVLKRSPEQTAALHDLLLGQQEKSSSDFHHWLSPQEFGQKFGPGDADVQAVTNWLGSEGFQVNRVSNGRTVIEFSGTAGLVREALGAEIHRYLINGKSYVSNATNPEIPAALAPVIEGIASLNNFPRRPLYREMGVFSRSRKTGRVKPLYTLNCPSGSNCSAPAYYGLGPTDFATIYNILPLWNASPAINGAGVTIGIVADSNINTQDVVNFRNVFGLPAFSSSCPNASPCLNVILDGPDPGLIPGGETEADADAEWSGAVAKEATIDVVVSEDTESTSGLDLSALYIADNNLAPIMSESYGACESMLGNAGNALEKAISDQAAAEGITVLAAAGDSGSAGCDEPSLENAATQGLAVNGVASVPNTVSVGGTDFEAGSSPSSYFTSTSDTTTQNSAKSYIPEMPWNDSCARAGNANGCSTVSPYGTDLVGGGGGPSGCAVQDSSGGCTAGYTKPAWQSGTGVPNDGVRDTPDISMFAGDGSDYVFYVVCAADQISNITGAGDASCSGSMSSFDFMAIGGTSVSTQVFAGVMALVNQKTGQRQGNANYILYPMAAQAATASKDCTSNSSAVTNNNCIFYDIASGEDASGNVITPGNNSVACAAGSPDCSAKTSGYGILINPNNSATQTPAWQTTANYDLASGLGSMNVTNLVNNWTSSFTASTTTLLSPGPTTMTHGATVTVNGTVSPSSATGSVELMGVPAGVSSNLVANAKYALGTFALSGGAFSGTTNKLPGGTYNVFAHYAGDGTNGASDSAPVAVTVSPEASSTQLHVIAFDPSTGQITSSNATSFAYGSPYILRVDVLNSQNQPCAPMTNETTSAGTFPVQGTPTSGCPTGTVTWTLALNSQGYAEDQPIQFPAGTHALVANYGGDSSFSASVSTPDTITVAQARTLASITNPGTEGSGTPFNLAVAVNTVSNSAVGPTGTVQIYNGTTAVGNPATCSPSGASAVSYASCQATATITLTSSANLTAQYSGDANYGQSPMSAAVPVSVGTPDFQFGGGDVFPSVIPGGSGTATTEVLPVYGFTGTVNLTCAVTTTLSVPAGDMPTCTLNPASVTFGSNPVNVTVTSSTVAPSLVPPAPIGAPPSGGWPVALWIGMLALVALAAFRERRNPAGAKASGTLALRISALLLFAALWASCGGGGGGGGGGGNPGTPAGSYTLTITGTSGSLKHSTALTLTVQ